MIRKVIYHRRHRGFRVNACKLKKQGLYIDILDPAIDQLTHLLERHSRITVLRFDCRFPANWVTDRKLENAAASQLSQMIKDNLGLKRWGSHKDVAYGWVYEVGNQCNHPHYHFYIAFKALTLSLGAITYNGYTGLLGVIQSCWNRLTGGSTYFCGTHTVNRGNHKELDACVYHISYMAKVDTKIIGMGNKAKNFSFSRLKPKTVKSPRIAII